MMLLSATLFWGISVLFSTECKSASIAGTRSNSTTAEPNYSKLHNETETQPTTWDPTPTHKREEGSVSAASDSAAPPTTGADEGVVSHRSDSSGSSPRPLTTVAGDARPSHNATVSETVKLTADTSPTPSTGATATAKSSAASSAPWFASSPWTALPVESDVSPSTTSGHSTPRSVSALTAGPTSDPASSPLTITKTPANSPGRPSTPQPTSDGRTSISTPSQFPDTATTRSHGFSTSTSANSTTPAGVLIPRNPRRFPTPSAKIATTARAASKRPQGTELPPCSSRSVARHCLIAIASLAALAATFMVCTVVLCTKLSARKRRLGKPQQSTEMMCISALLPEERSYNCNYNYARQRNPITNGVLVMPRGGDSDDEGGDNLTLSSFLPENDRSV